MSVFTIVDAISWTLLHFLWQASVVAGLLALLLPIIRGRYAASSFAMLTLAGVAAGTFLVQLGLSSSKIPSHRSCHGPSHSTRRMPRK